MRKTFMLSALLALAVPATTLAQDKPVEVNFGAGFTFPVGDVADSFDTDARPTEVTWVGPNVLMLFSGKISTCVAGATCVREMLIQDLRAPSTMAPLHSQRIATH